MTNATMRPNWTNACWTLTGQLFIRRPHGLEPTQRAVELGPRIETVLELIDAAVSEDKAFDPAKTQRRFKIACPDHVASLICDRLVETFRREAPSASFSTRPAILEQALQAVRRGEVDIAIGAFNQIPAGLSGEVLYDDDYCVIAREDHPIVQKAVDLRTYLRIGHVFVGSPDGPFVGEPAWDRKVLAATYGDLPGPELVRTHA